MKITVDFDLCSVTGGCTQVCPDVFEIRDDGYLYVLDDEPGAELHDAVRDAADICPTGAIELVE